MASTTSQPVMTSAATGPGGYFSFLGDLASLARDIDHEQKRRVRRADTFNV
jgi:hypothetical protein